MAERVRFELTSPVRSLRFSRPVQSTALPPLRSNQLNHLRLFYQAAEADSEVGASILFPLCAMSRASASPVCMAEGLPDRDDVHAGREQVTREGVPQMRAGWRCAEFAPAAHRLRDEDAAG